MGTIELNSDVIRFEIRNKSIALIQLYDIEHKNTLTKNLMNGLSEAFQWIENSQEVKVVVLVGYDSYFCCGSTQDDLFEIAGGKTKFTDFPFYNLLLNCELPTISAMQGHAIGGGLVLGAFGDFMFLAEESIYSANFMRYGFTPGAGSTLMIPYKFGRHLGMEMLFSADNYFGKHLKERLPEIRIVQRKEVLNEALLFAEKLAQKPLISLKLLKEQMSRDIKEQLQQTIKHEVDMHEISLKQPEVKSYITKSYN